MTTMEDIFTYSNLNDAFYNCFKANKNKHSNQVY